MFFKVLGNTRLYNTNGIIGYHEISPDYGKRKKVPVLLNALPKITPEGQEAI